MAITIPSVNGTAALSPDNTTILILINGAIQPIPVPLWLDLVHGRDRPIPALAWTLIVNLIKAGVDPRNAAASIAWINSNPIVAWY